MSSRILNDWISFYLKYTENTEPPESYHHWTALSLIAGTLQRKVYLRWGHGTIYPNLYIVLIGPSGRTRKGTAMDLGIDIFKETGLPITAESITREALIKALSEAINSYNDPDTKEIEFHCSLTTFSKELSVFLGERDIRFLADLTDWYDSADRWKYETKNSGKFLIRGICYNLLGATAPDWLQTMIPMEAIGGGFTSRIIFIVEEKKAKTVIFPVMTSEEKELKIALIKDLQKIANLGGEIRFDPKAKEMYANWYEIEDKKMDRGEFVIPDPRFSGYCERRPTHIRKLSMILSASRGDDRTITELDFSRAQTLLENAEKKMAKVFGGVGRSNTGTMVFTILEYIKEHKKVSKTHLVKTFYRDMTTSDLDEIEKVLFHMKVIIRVYNEDKKEYEYTYVGGE